VADSDMKRTYRAWCRKNWHGCFWGYASLAAFLNGIVYHFYCAVNDMDQRGIAVASSKEMDKSNLSFSRKNK